MSLYKEWHDFVRYNLADKVQSEAQRLDVSKAVVGIGTTKATDEQRRRNFSELTRCGLIVHQEDMVGLDDEFEAMEVNAVGHVFIWTKQFVYGLTRDGDTERFWAFPRNPPV